MSDPVACPRCRRPNAPHRAACLYCGAELPEPTAPPPPKERALPADLDDLVRAALTKGDIGRLRTALSQAPAPPPPVAPRARTPPSASPPAARPAPAAPIPAWPPPPGPPAAPPADREGIARALEAAAARLRGGADAGDLARELAALVAPLGALAGPLPAVPAPAAADLPPAPPPLPARAPRAGPPVLPPMRQRWMLVVEGPEEEARAEAVAAALRVDRVTARLVAIARHPRVALRGEDPAALHEAAARLRAEAGLRAAVCSRDELLGVGPPCTALAALGPGWRATATEAWTAEPDALPRGRAAAAFPVRLVVPGEVVVRRYRDGRGVGRSSRGDRVLREAAERRSPVLDLHGPGGFLRLVAGITDTTGLPGHDPSSALLSFKNLLEGFDAAWPGAQRVGARSCAPGLAPAGTEPGAEAEVVEASGWPAWEEHTRCCRLWAGIAGDPPPLVDGA